MALTVISARRSTHLGSAMQTGPLAETPNWETDHEDDRAGVFSHRVAPSQAAQKTHAKNNDASVEQKCHEMVGKEPYEGEGRGGGRLQAQRFGECMMGMPH